jgi:hypothetical protein
MEQIIKLELTVAEVNAILASLGKHPFDQIASLISKIKQQGDSQITPPESNEAVAE